MRPRRLSANVVALGVVSLLTDVSTEIVYPLLPLFMTSLGASALFIGLVEGIADTTASLLKLIAGWLSDRLGRRKALVLAGYGLSTATRPLIALAAAPWHVLVVRFLDRVGKGFRGAPRDALIADSTEPGMLGKAFGFHRAMDHLGAVLGPLIAFALLQTWLSGGAEGELSSLRALFWVATVPALLAVLTLALRVREVPARRTATRELPRLSLRPFDARFRRFLGIAVLFTLGNSSDAFLLLRAQQLGVPIPLLPVLWGALHVVKSVSSVPGSGWSDRVGRRPAIALGWGIYALVYLGFAVASETWHAWALFAVYGLYFGLTEGSEKALVADLVPSELRSTAYGVYGCATGLVALPASLLMGWLWVALSPQAAFVCGAALALAATLLLTRLPLAAKQE